MTPTEFKDELERLQTKISFAPADADIALRLMRELIDLIKELPELKTQ